MDSLTQYETLTLIIAMLGVVVSLVALVRTRRLNEQQLRLRRKQEELTDLQLQLLRRQVAEEVRTVALPPADVRISLEDFGGNHRFVVTNWGYGPARDVKVTIEPREGRTSPLVRGDYDEKLPIRELLPGERVILLAALTFGTGTSFDSTLTWLNANGDEQRRASRVSLG